MGGIYELTGPRSQGMDGDAREYSNALNREVYSSDGRATTTREEKGTILNSDNCPRHKGSGLRTDRVDRPPPTTLSSLFAVKLDFDLRPKLNESWILKITTD